MGFKIREVRKADFANLTEAIDIWRQNIEYEWVLQDPKDPEKYKGFVAVDDDDKVFGVIGYVESEYAYQDQVFKGVIPMTWRVNPKYKGFAGVQLFKRALLSGEFKFAIGGSDSAKELYAAFKIGYKGQVLQYYKVLRPIEYLLSSKKKLLTNLGFLLYTSPSFLFGRFVNTKSSQLTIEPYNPKESYEFDNPFEKEVFAKRVSPEYVNWLLSCPILESEAFIIRYNQKCLGAAVCYVEEVQKANRGRIVHMPYLGADSNLWQELMQHLVHYFKSKSCTYITALGNAERVKKGLKAAHFIGIKRKSRPFYIKDQDGILSGIPVEEWNIQFSEGDKAYRNL